MRPAVRTTTRVTAIALSLLRKGLTGRHLRPSSHNRDDRHGGGYGPGCAFGIGFDASMFVFALTVQNGLRASTPHGGWWSCRWPCCSSRPPSGLSRHQPLRQGRAVGRCRRPTSWPGLTGGGCDREVAACRSLVPVPEPGSGRHHSCLHRRRLCADGNRRPAGGRRRSTPRFTEDSSAELRSSMPGLPPRERGHRGGLVHHRTTRGHSRKGTVALMDPSARCSPDRTGGVRGCTRCWRAVP